MKKIIFIIFSLLVFTFLVKVEAEEVDYAPNAGSTILIEATTGKVLYEKNSNKVYAPASMTKMMTLLLIMEELESGRIKLEDKVMISVNAASMGGTQIFIEANSEVVVSDLLKGIGIASANDASVAMAEYIGGSEENFVNMMNKRALKLGAKNTTFKNCHGLDEKGHETTAYDMALIAKELVKHESILKITSTYEEYINVSGKNHWLVNTNTLIKFYNGVDGLKTGYTDNAKYCLTATMRKNDMRLISVVMKEESKENRTSDTIKLMEYGYSMYGIKKVLSSEESLGKVYIENSKERYFDFYLKEDVNIVVDKNTRELNYEISKEVETLKAPIKANTKVGILKLNYNNNVVEYDLIIKSSISKRNYLGLLINNFQDVIHGNLNVLN